MKSKRAEKLGSIPLDREYPDRGRCIHHKNLGGTPLLQKDFGKAKGCTVTSLAFLYGAERYPQIEKIAKRYGYNGDRHGTNPLRIKTIMQACSKQLGLGGVCRARYGKGIGYTYKRIKALIDSGAYVLLNLLDDGRGYYHDHTVTVIGYEEYERGRFLTVFDNWNLDTCYVDFDKLSIISGINWMQ